MIQSFFNKKLTLALIASCFALKVQGSTQLGKQTYRDLLPGCIYEPANITGINTVTRKIGECAKGLWRYGKDPSKVSKTVRKAIGFSSTRFRKAFRKYPLVVNVRWETQKNKWFAGEHTEHVFSVAYEEETEKVLVKMHGKGARLIPGDGKAQGGKQYAVLEEITDFEKLGEGMAKIKFVFAGMKGRVCNRWIYFPLPSQINQKGADLPFQRLMCLVRILSRTQKIGESEINYGKRVLIQRKFMKQPAIMSFLDKLERNEFAPQDVGDGWRSLLGSKNSDAPIGYQDNLDSTSEDREYRQQLRKMFRDRLNKRRAKHNSSSG